MWTGTTWVPFSGEGLTSPDQPQEPMVPQETERYVNGIDTMTGRPARTATNRKTGARIYWNEDRQKAYIFLAFSALAVFMYFFRKKYRKRFENQEKKK